ncbi:MAG: hypothetical protein Satyrvirus1_71 [Satyrvirus sp.]|uniref:TIGR03118 family protein n=1 Tax=Satyrvirus sp. TaxID=2487771 RepID=A0A3G5ACN0_9VIRU|nr:MAG: hypothetical protein Satyrvirus1_71 [Satyrvirus sp.]
MLNPQNPFYNINLPPFPCTPSKCGPYGPGPLINAGFPRRAVATWRINYLISNRPSQAAHFDLDLVNPWGIVVHDNQLWVVNNSSDTITNFDLFGNKLIGAAGVREAGHNSAFPTGLVINCCGGFPVSNGTITKSARFITATEYGTINGYNPLIDPLNTFIVVDMQLTGAVTVYRGLTLANGLLYLADFFNARIDVFDVNFNKQVGYVFVDGDTVDPVGVNFAPNNIVHIGCFIYVLWARKDTNVAVHELDGPGNGFISVFNFDGSFVRRFTSRGVLNSPWAMIPAPCECGFPPGSFLVGNHGDGRINVFDCDGKYVGPLLNQSGLPMVIDGLWGLAPRYADFNEIFFTSSTDENNEGLLGSIVRDQVIFL